MRKGKITSVILAAVLTLGSLGSTNVWAEEFFSAENAAESSEAEIASTMPEEADTQEQESGIASEGGFAEEAQGFGDGNTTDISVNGNIQEEAEENAFSSEENEEFVLEEEAVTDPLTLSNNTSSTAKTISVNTIYSSNFTNSGDELWLKFTLSSPGSISFSFRHDYIDSSSTYWYAKIYEADAFSELANYSFKGNTVSYVQNRFGVKSGTYYVKLNSGNFSNVNFKFRINYTEAGNWEKEVNDVYGNASVINSDTLFYGSLQNSNDVDWYKVTISTAGNHRFLFEHEYMESSSEYWRTKIYDSEFKELATYNYKGNVQKSENKLNLEKTGTYYIKVEKRNYSDSIYSIKMSPNWQSTPYGILPADALYYNGHYYYVYDLYLTWKETKAYFGSLGGYLATITSQAENDAVYQYIKKMGYENAFFGFTDETTEGKWKWVTGETADYTNWSPGEPNGGSAEDYAMFYYKYPSGKWNDGDFGGRTQKNHKAVICEWGTYSVHTHSYQYSVTPATISKEGYISQKCSCGDEKNKTTIYCPSKAIFSKAFYTYTGKAQKPKLTLYDSKMNVIDSSNYTVSYESNPKSIGKHTAYLKFKNHYSGTGTSTYVINPKGTSIKSLKGSSRAVKVKWGKVKTCTGYQVQYSTNKKFTNAYNYSVSSKSKTSATIKYLRGKTRYYVRVRSYKTVGSEKYYSAWSKTKSVKTKR